MGRRGGTHSFRCQFEGGCRETAWVQYDSQRELRELMQSSYYKNYRCSRHSQMDKVLSEENTAVQTVLVARDSWNKPIREGAEPSYVGRFWRQEGDVSGNGFNSSSAHKAFAKDFPEGTRLVITAYIETPEVQARFAGEELVADA